MIDKLSYEEVLNISKELQIQVENISKLAEEQNLSELKDFCATVEGYSKFLENTVEINKDADKALSYLASQLKN